MVSKMDPKCLDLTQTLRDIKWWAIVETGGYLRYATQALRGGKKNGPERTKKEQSFGPLG